LKMNNIIKQSDLVLRLEYALEVAKEEGNCNILRVNLAYLSARINDDYEQDKKEKMDLIKELEKVYKATGTGNVYLENRLNDADVETHFTVDYVFFTKSHSNKVLYGFEL